MVSHPASRPPPLLHRSSADSPLFTSLPLQISLFVDVYYQFLYFLLAILTFLYKVVKYPYPRSILGWETAALSILAIVEISRLLVGNSGNLTRSVRSLLLFFLLNLPCIAALVYFMLYETYVLRLDQINNGISLSLIITESFFTLFTVIAINNKQHNWDSQQLWIY